MWLERTEEFAVVTENSEYVSSSSSADREKLLSISLFLPPL